MDKKRQGMVCIENYTFDFKTPRNLLSLTKNLLYDKNVHHQPIY